MDKKDLFDPDMILHEAGHAITAAALGRNVEAVAVLKAGDLLADGSGGFVNSDKGRDPIEEAAILFGGVVGNAFGTGRDYGLIERTHAATFKKRAKAHTKQATAGQTTYKPITEKSDSQIRSFGCFDIVAATKILKGRHDSDFELSQKIAMACIALNLGLLHELAQALKDHYGLLRGADLQSILFRAVRPTAEQVNRL